MNVYKGRMPTKIKLTLEQSQQGVSNDVLVSIEGVEELKRNVWIKGEKNEALHTTLGRNRVNTYAVRITMLIADIEDDIMDPVMQCTTLPSHSGFSQKKLVSFVTKIHTTSIDFLTPMSSSKQHAEHLKDGVVKLIPAEVGIIATAPAHSTQTFYKHKIPNPAASSQHDQDIPPPHSKPDNFPAIPD
ncbi:hypothetical protein Tco_0749025 [Tanacetum coccineum]|uniref:Uncharacterized protein n=1 Tax=Tanacetum coccineum TaxID=301880 RepID=A0ABQ4YX98_9ASTR